MKKIITDTKTLAALLMAGAALAACSSEGNIVEEQPANPAQHTYTMTIEATKGGDAAATRALALDGKTLNATWQTTDKVAVYNYTQKAALEGHLSPQSDGASATLTGSLTGSVKEGDDVILRWPSVDADYTGQDGTLETIAQSYDYTTGIAKVTSVDGTAIVAEDSSPNGGPVTFTNSQAIVKFTLTDKANDAPIRATQLTIDAKVNGESRLIQSFTYPNAYTLGPITINRTTPTDNVVYAALPFSSQAHFTFNLTATDGTNTYTYEKAGVTMLNGRYYEITVKMNASQATPLTFEAKEAGASVTFNIHTSTATNPVEYSTGGSSWTTYTSGTAITLENVGDKVMFRGDNATYSGGGNYDYSTFTCDKDCYVYGNVMSLVSSTDYKTATTLTAGRTFRKLFEGNTHIVNHPTLSIVLPATTLTNSCYYAMFDGCSQLTKAPALPATKMEQGCYWGMFSETGITAAPALPATTLANACYMLMFDNCPHLTTPPDLPATTLAESCYAGMFSRCSSLEYAPALPATTMVKDCYYAMFTMCGKITTAPQLPAATLAEGCYMSMFSQCTNLNSVTCLATNISAKNCTYDWLTGVAATGTFTKAGEMTGWTTGGNGIPEGWTMARAYTLAESTVGMIVGSDGLAYYASDKNDLPSGVTAVAMVAYKSATAGESLAIQLNGSPVSKKWADAKTYASGLTAVPGGTWRLPSKADWQNMFVGCAKSGDAGVSDEMDPIAGFKEKIGATGITWQSDDSYWSSTGSGSGAWYVNVYLDDSVAVACFYENDASTPCSVLGCLAF